MDVPDSTRRWDGAHPDGDANRRRGMVIEAVAFTVGCLAVAALVAGAIAGLVSRE